MKSLLFFFIACVFQLSFAQNGFKSCKFLSADTGFTAGNLGVFKTVDGGLYWTPKLPPDYWKDLEFRKNIGIVVGWDGKIFRSSDHGETWNQINAWTVNPLRDITFINDSTIFIVGYNTILKSQNYGITWNISTFPLYFQRIAFKDENIGIAVGYSLYSQAGIYRTTNGGITWQQGLALPQYTAFSAIAHISGEKWIMTEQSGYLYITTDDGNTWTSRVRNAYPKEILFINADSGVLLELVGSYSTDGRIRRSTDGGETWLASQEIPPGDLYEPVLSYTPPGYLYLISDTWLLKSTNSGYSWLPIAIPVELTSFTASSYGDKVTLNWTTATETNNFGFEIERLSGNDWITRGFVQGSGTTSELRSYSFIDITSSPGKYSYRLKQFDYDGSFSYSHVIEAEIIPGQYELRQNYPNPFNPSTVIEFTLPVTTLIQLSVYDPLGREVKILLNEQLTAGNHSVNFNAAELPAGVYFCKLDAGNFTSIMKLILLK